MNNFIPWKKEPLKKIMERFERSNKSSLEKAGSFFLHPDKSVGENILKNT